MAKKQASPKVKEDKAPALQQAVPPKVDAAPHTEETPKPEPAKADVLNEAQQAAIDQVMATAREACQAILGGSPVAGLGTPSANQEETTDHVQSDSIPGTRRKDKTYIPKRIYDPDTGNSRPLLFDELHYMLVDIETIPDYIMDGWKMCLFDGGSLSGLAGSGFSGTGDSVMTRTIHGYCQRGDCRLMWAPHKLWEELRAADEYENSISMQRALGSFANAGYREGIRAEAVVDGKPVFSDKKLLAGA